jgi:hypothetical protein
MLILQPNKKIVSSYLTTAVQSAKESLSTPDLPQKMDNVQNNTSLIGYVCTHTNVKLYNACSKWENCTKLTSDTDQSYLTL